LRHIIVIVFLLGFGLSVSRSTGEVPAGGEGKPAAVASAQPACTPVVGGAAEGSQSGQGCPDSCPRLAALKAQVATLETQLRVWGDRGRVDLIESIILNENPNVPFATRRDIAKAFVKTADKLQIPLLAGVAIADEESKFSNDTVGRHGEASLMQILPLPGRPTCAQLKANPELAISWALENCFSPPYHQALAEGKSTDEAIKNALKTYNRHDSYVEKVYQRYLWMKDFEAKGLYGWDK